MEWLTDFVDVKLQEDGHSFSNECNLIKDSFISLKKDHMEQEVHVTAQSSITWKDKWS